MIKTCCNSDVSYHFVVFNYLTFFNQFFNCNITTFKSRAKNTMMYISVMCVLFKFNDFLVYNIINVHCEFINIFLLFLFQNNM
jgi:hypothetical protein